MWRYLPPFVIRVIVGGQGDAVAVRRRIVNAIDDVMQGFDWSVNPAYFLGVARYVMLRDTIQPGSMNHRQDDFRGDTEAGVGLQRLNRLSDL